MGVHQQIKSEFAQFVADVRRQAAAAGDFNEERLTAPCRKLLEVLLQAFGYAGHTVVDKTAVRAGRRVGVPDLSVYDPNGRLRLCVELKAPGKGADPTRFVTAHDARQWRCYKSLPNLIYTDGGDWALYHNGRRAMKPQTVCADLTDPNEQVNVNARGMRQLFDQSFRWAPKPITSLDGLAKESARRCRGLRDQVAVFDGLTEMTRDWRDLLFPDLDDGHFLDAYAQTVTFAVLSAASLGIPIALPPLGSAFDGLNLQLHHVASELGKRRGLLGRALSLLTGDEEVREHLGAHLETLLAAVTSVDWIAFAPTGADWLNFYEEFLAAYDPALRRQSGSYYTPAPVVEWMTTFTDRLLADVMGVERGYDADDVLLVDPGVGTGTFLLSALDRIEARVAASLGPGAVESALRTAAKARLVGFEIQACPYAVAQLRLTERLSPAGSARDNATLRLYLTDTLADPASEPQEALFAAPITESRAAANKVKREEPVVVVIGNPPYLDHAAGKGGWVEKNLMDAWRPPPEWGVGPHVKNLSNLYVYFWRWAAWKVFGESQTDAGQHPRSGVVSLITTTGFLTGDGFQMMRQWLRERCTHIWVLHLSPEGHHAPAGSQIFGAMRQPVAIVTAARRGDIDHATPAKVRYHMVPLGGREDKMLHIRLLLNPRGEKWETLPTDSGPQGWRAPFSPSATGAWADMPAVGDMFPWSGSGVMIGRTWPVSPDPRILRRRWRRLIGLNTTGKRAAFVEHPRDRPVTKALEDNLHQTVPKRPAIADETSTSPPGGVRAYGYRSFDRQHLIADKRLINQPNPSFWAAHSDTRQIYVSVPALGTDSTRPLVAGSGGAVVSFTDLIPDMQHLAGSRAGRQIPLWRDLNATHPNIATGLLDLLAAELGRDVSAEDFFAYTAAVVAHPAYTETFRDDLRFATQIRLPITRDEALFENAVSVGQRVLWLHTFKQRYPAGAATLSAARAPKIVAAIPDNAERLSRDPNTDSLIVHSADPAATDGAVRPVTAEVFSYEVAHMNVLDSWFGYRKHNPAGSRKSPLDDINPTTWPVDYSRNLVELLEVLTLLTGLRPTQHRLLDDILNSPPISGSDLEAAGVLPPPDAQRQKPLSLQRQSLTLDV